MEVIHSLQLAENFSADIADMILTIAQALTECEVIEEAEHYLHLLQTLPDFHPSKVFELLYECAKYRQDSERCIEYLLRALESMDEGPSEKKQQLAILLTQLYDERGELLHSVDITNKYINKSRHIVGMITIYSLLIFQCTSLCEGIHLDNLHRHVQSIQ